jgi:signal peptidase I
MTSVVPTPDPGGAADPADHTAAAASGGPGAGGEVPSTDAKSKRRGRKRKDDNWTRSAVEWVLVIVGALAVAMAIKVTTVQAFYIPSASMEPTLQVGDRVLVNKWSYRLHDVNRGDIVVFSRPPTEDSNINDLIKRVVGLPGETVTIDNNHVMIDGQVLDEPYLPAGTQTQAVGTEGCAPAKPCVVPDGEVFVMGDNRTNSKDSRYLGPIKESSIIGRAFVRVWPFTRLDAL